MYLVPHSTTQVFIPIDILTCEFGKLTLEVCDFVVILQLRPEFGFSSP